MLSSALQYLDDRRRRFQRSDTAPIIQLSCGLSDARESEHSPVGAVTFELSSSSTTVASPVRRARRSSSAAAKRRSMTPPAKGKLRHQGSQDSVPQRLHKARSFDRRSSVDANAHCDCASAHSTSCCSINNSINNNNNNNNNNNSCGSKQSLTKMDSEIIRPQVAQKEAGLCASRPYKFNKQAFVRQLTRYNSAKTIEDMKKEWNSAQKTLRDASDLFTAIEHGDLASVQSALEKSPSLLNAVNDFNLQPLDIAMLRSRAKVADYLISIGGRNNAVLSEPRKMNEHLNQLIESLGARIIELASRYCDGSATQKVEKEISRLEQSLNHLKQLRFSFNHMMAPSAPSKVALDVTGLDSVRVTIAPPVDCTVTQFKIEWSLAADFADIVGEKYISVKLPQAAVTIGDLITGKLYFFRASALNLKGWGQTRSAEPPCVNVRSWRDRLDAPQRYGGPLDDLEELKKELEQICNCWLPLKAAQRAKYARAKSPKFQRRRSFKNLFFSSIKFAKNPRSGIYLSLVAHCDNRVLLYEDQLPYLFIDDMQSLTTLPADAVWLMKILSNDQEMRQFRDQVNFLGVPSRLNFRMKLIASVLQLQQNLGMTGLRAVYPELIKRNDVICLVLVKDVTDPREVTLCGGLKWCSLDKRLKKSSNSLSISSDSIQADSSSGSFNPEEEHACIDDYLSFSRCHAQKLERGLYVAYIRLNCQVDFLEVMVPTARPSLPPLVKMRDNQYVTREEWEFFRERLTEEGAQEECPGSFHAKFRKAFFRSWTELQEELEMSPEEASMARVYSAEVVEISPDVSLILVFPSVEKVCLAPGSQSVLPSARFSWIPLRFHEALSLMTYEPAFFAAHSTLASRLEILLPMAHQAQREAFSKEELELARRRTDQLMNMQARLERLSSTRRWAVDAITCAREKQLEKHRMVPLSGLASSPGGSSTLSDIEKVLAEQETMMEPRVSTPGPTGASACEDDALPAMGTMRLYADYPTGLAEGTSVKIFLTAKTTVREIVSLVVRQLNMAGQLKCSSSPVYGADMLLHFQLVGIKADASEVVFPDDLHPLLLDTSWKAGRFCLRLTKRDSLSD